MGMLYILGYLGIGIPDILHRGAKNGGSVDFPMTPGFITAR